MSDTNEPFWFKQERKRILQNFIDQESNHKTRKNDAKDASDWVTQFARLSKGVTEPGPQRDNFDAITPMKLRSFKTKNPKDAVMQIILNQMGHNPLEAVRLFETYEAQNKEELSLKEAQKKEELSLVMSNIAKKPRPWARKVYSEAITEFVSREPNIAPKELLQRFKDHQDFEVGDDLIRHITEPDVMKISALRAALGRAKKKIRPRKK